LKSIIAIALASLFFLQSAEKLIIVANYELNKEYISKNLCENKAKPMMHCNGKCHLRKQLQKEDKKENAPSNNVKEKFEVQFFYENKATNLSSYNTNVPTKLNSNYLFSDYSKHLLSIFHPPQA
jgi:hypothetical protein